MGVESLEEWEVMKKDQGRYLTRSFLGSKRN